MEKFGGFIALLHLVWHAVVCSAWYFLASVSNKE